jgi:hypothetical protein
MDVSFLKRIDASVKTIMKDGKIDQYDIPEMVMLIADLSSTKKMTSDELAKAMTDLFNYIMDHYKLFPSDEAQKEGFKRLFEMSVKLVLFQPKIKEMCSWCVA